jgi:hypothetical protein
MAFLEKQPTYIKKKIALIITVIVGVLLIGIMFLSIRHQKSDVSKDGATTKIGQFYTTIIKSAQSYFGGERAIINK